MRTIMLCFFAMVAICAVIPGPASAQLELYDDFETKLLDPAKWFGRESVDTGVNILESRRQIKIEPILVFRGLNLVNRSYAASGSDAGRKTSATRVRFVDGTAIKTIQAQVLIKKFAATACDANTAPTEPRIRIGGMFFNTGTSTPDDSTNDVRAFIYVGRPTDATDLKKKQLKIYAVIDICNNADCTDSSEIASQVIGTVKVNKRVRLSVTWDQANNRFLFKKGNAEEVPLAYAVPVGSAPGTSNGGNKRLEIHHLIPNCTAARPVCFMEAFFDNVMIDTSP